MKDPKDWDLDDLQELIATQAEESSTLEFKHGKILEDLNTTDCQSTTENET